HHQDRKQVRGRLVHAEPARPSAHRQRPGPPRVRNRQHPSRGRSLDLRRAGGADPVQRGPAARLLPRPVRPPLGLDAVNPIPLSRPPVDDEIKRAVLAAIDSRQYILGPQCRLLEGELARATGVPHALLTSSGTAALWLTLRSLGVKAGDEVLAARCLRRRAHGRIDKTVHAEGGFNLRYNELQAAALRVLLPRLDAMNDRRRALAARYAEGLAGLPLVLPAERASARHVYH